MKVCNMCYSTISIEILRICRAASSDNDFLIGENFVMEKFLKEKFYPTNNFPQQIILPDKQFSPTINFI